MPISFTDAMFGKMFSEVYQMAGVMDVRVTTMLMPMHGFVRQCMWCGSSSLQPVHKDWQCCTWLTTTAELCMTQTETCVGIHVQADKAIAVHANSSSRRSMLGTQLQIEQFCTCKLTDHLHRCLVREYVCTYKPLTAKPPGCCISQLLQAFQAA